MIGSGILFFISLVLYFIFYSLSGTYVFLETLLPVLMWVAVALGVLFAVFVIVTLIKTIFK